MIIKDYAVKSSSSYQYQKATAVSVKSSNAVIPESELRKKAEEAERAKDPQDTVELGKDGQEEKAKGKTIQEIAEQIKQDSNNRLKNAMLESRGVGASRLPKFLRPESAKVDLLIKMLEAMTGKKIKTYEPEKLVDNNRNQNSFIGNWGGQASNGLSGGNMVQVRTVSAEYASYESESMSYSAQGVINTADGRSISVDVNMSMSRETAEYMRFDVSTVQQQKQLCDPLVINYAGTAASLTNQTYDFDLTMDGKAEQISFAGEGSGFLALDKNSDGKIGDGSELFGPQTGSGFGELRAYDTDGNNWIDEADDVYSKLVVYTKDAQGNDQMFKLKDLDIGAIYLGDVSTQFTMNGTDGTQGMMRSTSFFLKDSGGAGTVSHIDLAY